jgi:hypothetical protein
VVIFVVIFVVVFVESARAAVVVAATAAAALAVFVAAAMGVAFPAVLVVAAVALQQSAAEEQVRRFACVVRWLGAASVAGPRVVAAQRVEVSRARGLGGGDRGRPAVGREVGAAARVGQVRERAWGQELGKRAVAGQRQNCAAVRRPVSLERRRERCCCRFDRRSAVRGRVGGGVRVAAAGVG